MRRDPWPGRGYKPSPRQMRKELLPEGMERPKALEDLNRKAEESIATYEKALADSVEARQAAQAAPKQDAAEAVNAFERGDEPPEPSATRKKELADAAQVVVAHALERADAALAELSAGIDAHRDHLAEGVAASVEARAREVLAALDATETGFHELAEVAGHLSRLHDYQQHSEHSGKREFKRSPLFVGDLKVPEVIASFRRATEEMAHRATPFRKRIMDLVEAGVEDWEAITAKLGVSKLDTHARAARDFLLEETRELAWVDQGGNRMGRRQRQVVPGRRLVRSTPRETPTQRARRERRERQAQQAAPSPGGVHIPGKAA